ncbi:MAG: hypothetical protein KDB03_14255 [Planctomycetales bacterium]|nr:hypothetical protein [Planctomycetales bacterium]
MKYPQHRIMDTFELPEWAGLNRNIYRPESLIPSQTQQWASVKWGGITHVMPNRVSHWCELQPMLLQANRDPRSNDVMVGRVVDLGRHTSIELSCGRKAEIYLGDILVGAFGNRYATNQYEGVVPSQLQHYHVLSQGAVFGQVISACGSMSDPTVIEPLGYINDGNGQPLNLTQFGITPCPNSRRIPTLLVLGSSMDAGKTTTAAALVRGLSLAGWRVHAGKLTGTGCAKDINKMRDAGAQKVLDFTSCGYVSTASTTIDELDSISSRLIDHLSIGSPDVLVLEIADGIIQTETDKLARKLVAEKKVDGAILAIHDVLSVRMASKLIEQDFGIPLFGISGVSTRSPLSSMELRRLTTHAVYDLPALSDPTIAMALEDFLASNASLSVHKRAIVA